MKIALINAVGHSACTLKDVAGGFGTVFEIGTGPLARVLQAAKGHIAALPNITLAYLDQILTAHGAEVRVLNLRKPEELVAADLYLIASSIVDCQLELRVGIAAKRRFSGVVGYFGTFAAAVPEFYQPAADFVITGEIENIAASLAQGTIPKGIVNAGFIDNLAELPFPRWEQFPIATYRYKIIASRGITLPMMGSRGCLFQCGYCPYKVNAWYRDRSIASLVAEISYLHQRYGVRGISFRDPLRTFSQDSAAMFVEQLQQAGLDIRFSMEYRSDLLDARLLQTLYRAGLRSLEIGIESCQPQTVDHHGRRPPAIEQQERVIQICHQLGIHVIANYLLGLPNDSKEGMLATIAMAKRLNTFAVQFTVATPYPGTAMYEELKGKIHENDWEKFNGWTNVFNHPSMTAQEIHRLREWAYVTYHFRPAYLWHFFRSQWRNGW